MLCKNRIINCGISMLWSLPSLGKKKLILFENQRRKLSFYHSFNHIMFILIFSWFHNEDIHDISYNYIFFTPIIMIHHIIFFFTIVILCHWFHSLNLCHGAMHSVFFSFNVSCIFVNNYVLKAIFYVTRMLIFNLSCWILDIKS